MGMLTETEIFDCLRTNLRRAAEHCDKLAVIPLRGVTYDMLRRELKLVEGACRQAAYWRSGDARWLSIGLMMEEAHQRSLNWLLRSPSAEARKAAHPCFKLLAANLRALYDQCERLRTMRTGVIGPILPTPREAPQRETRPVSNSGLLLPPGFVDERSAA